MKPMPYLLITAGIILLIVGLLMLRRGGRIKEQEVIISPAEQLETKQQATDSYLENKAKGDAFEAFVVKSFDTTYFTINEWRGDKYVDGKYATSNHFPDLEITFTLEFKKVKDTFAIECKWRKSFYNNAITWAEDYQVKNYKEYAAKLNIPVFVVIGIGGEPSKPHEVYIVPLEKIKTTELTEDFLQPYQREFASNNFYWKWEGKKLI